MQKPTSIQLHIPTPCHEDWNAMTPDERGRFCGQCQKTVVDFTTWSDADLFNFFQKNTRSVCGRFFNGQLHKEIHLPPQPKSRLYRIAIACSLTLMFTQLPEAHSMVKQQVELLSGETNDEDKDDKTGTGGVKGNVVDEDGKPVQGVKITVIKGKTEKAATVTDKHGKYFIPDLPVGKYHIFAKRNRDVSSREVVVNSSENTVVDMTINHFDTMSVGMVAMPVDFTTRGEVVPIRDTTKRQNDKTIKKGKIKINK